MRGLILHKGETYYSKFGLVFQEIEELAKEYNWLVSYPECYPENIDCQEIFNKNYIWLSGDELLQILREENFQWIWGVLSGFDKSIQLEDILKEPLPDAENEDVWKNPLTIQHSLATIEIMAWDSSYSLFISKNDAIIEKISIIYPLAEDLEEYNAE